MNIQKELANHAKEMEKVDRKFYSRFKHAYDYAINSKARNIRSIDKIAQDNVNLDKQIHSLDVALSVTTPPPNK